MKLKVRPAVVALVTLFAQCDSPATGVKHHHRPRPPLMKCFRLALAGLVINRYQTITKHCASSSASVCTPLIGRYCAVGFLFALRRPPAHKPRAHKLIGVDCTYSML